MISFLKSGKGMRRQHPANVQGHLPLNTDFCLLRCLELIQFAFISWDKTSCTICRFLYTANSHNIACAINV